MEFTQDEQKQLDDAAYEDKVRTFVQARALMKNKTNNRGFFPSVKGKFQKGKGMGKSKGKSTLSVMAASSSGPPAGGKGRQRPDDPEYTGCFICGSRDHSFQQCPKRQQRKGGAHYVDALFAKSIQDTIHDPIQEKEIYMVQEHDEATVAAWAVQSSQDEFHAVLDCGATETVASLHALTAIMSRREAKYGPEEFRVHEGIQKDFQIRQRQDSPGFLLCRDPPDHWRRAHLAWCAYPGH